MRVADNQLLDVDGLPGRECHLWVLPLDQPTWLNETWAGVLSVDEIARRERFVFESLQQRFQAGRGLLRVILSRYLVCHPRAIEFVYGKYGKPAVKDNTLGFNVAHSGGWQAVVVMAGADVGVDIEMLDRQADEDALVTRYFHPEEIKRYREIDSPLLKKEFFLKLWACKEAYLKMHGLGLSGGLDSVDIRIDSADGFCDVADVRGFAGQMRCLILDHCDPGCCLSYACQLVPKSVKMTCWKEIDHPSWSKLALF